MVVGMKTKGEGRVHTPALTGRCPVAGSHSALVWRTWPAQLHKITAHNGPYAHNARNATKLLVHYAAQLHRQSLKKLINLFGWLITFLFRIETGNFK